MERVSLPDFVALLKNLKGMLLVDAERELSEQAVKWLVSKFRYRRIGIDPAVLEEASGKAKRLLTRKVFVPLPFPSKSIADFCKSFLQDGLARQVVLASCYVIPGIVAGSEQWRAFEEFACWKMESTAPLPDVEVKRNLRIVGYAILDFHMEVSSKAYEALLEGKLRDLLSERAEISRKDGEKRFWRLKQEGEEEKRVVVAYLDPLRKAKREKLPQKLRTEEVRLALGIVPAFVFQ